MARYYSPYLQPTPSLGTGSRIIGSTIVGNSRASAGSSGRVYNWLKSNKGNFYAIQYFSNASFGPYRICPTKPTRLCLR